MSSAEVTFVIPIFNDSESLKELLRRIDQLTENVHFLILDNGSTDLLTSQILQSLPMNCTSVRVPKNLGFGGGIKAGLTLTHTPWVGWLPGNLKVNPIDAVNMCLNLEAYPVDSIVIKAHRINRPLIDQLKTIVAGIVQSIFARTLLHDTGGTPTIVSRSALSQILKGPDSYSFESYVLFVATMNGWEIRRPAVQYGKRMFGNSHWQNGLKSESKLLLEIVQSFSAWRKTLTRI